MGPKGLAKILGSSGQRHPVHTFVKLWLAILYPDIKGLLVGLNNPV